MSGIKHIEELSPRDFLSVVENLRSCIITEKVDGANLYVGRDENGLYTSREGKGGIRYHNSSEYLLIPANAAFIGAHEAIASVRAVFEKHLAIGDVIEVEVLYGRQPNAIVYGSNKIVFLRTVEGQANQRLLINALHNVSPVVRTIRFFSDDGIEIGKKYEMEKWTFKSVPIRLYGSHTPQLRDAIEEYKEWLSKPSAIGLTNEVTVGLNLNHTPVKDRPDARQARDVARPIDEAYKLRIKRMLCSTLLENKQSALCDVELEEYEKVGIEGLVIENRSNNLIVKLVNKEVFTKLNQFNHAVRNKLKDNIVNREEFGIDIQTSTNLYTDMMAAACAAMSIPYGSPLAINKQLFSKYKGARMKDTVSNVASVSKQSFEDIHVALIDIIGATRVQVADALIWYLDHAENIKLQVGGRQIGYSKEIHQRNLLFFAQLLGELTTMFHALTTASTKEDLVEIVFSKQLIPLH